MRLLYSLAWLLLLPFAFLYLVWRARRQPEYLRHWPERLGWIRAWRGGKRLWIHAVSVGETRAAAPLISAWRARHPECAILLTHGTPTGRETGRALYADSSDRSNDTKIEQAYLPYDFPPLVWLFLKRARPSMGVIMETEIWPNLFVASRKRNLPIFLVNARLSERSARNYARFGRLAALAVQSLRGVAAQTSDDGNRLAALGADSIRVTGNLKFDVGAPAKTEHSALELRQRFGDRFVWLAASTRQGEEALLLDALDRLALPDVLLVLVPRHPQRFEEVAQLIAARNAPWARRSKAGDNHLGNVFLGDSMGEMAAYYASADIAYVGGSLLPFGGQNLIEAAAAGCPALIGPHTWNFSEAATEAVLAGAARRVEDSAALVAELRLLHDDMASRHAMSVAGRQFAEKNRGATERTLELIETAWTDAA
ncbi:MAG: 3-deoxy-D-manno-octulosonic acid transferase [Hydrogenophilales bacterium 28-61-23]|nr:MAG: 3-deoxy-D-manno-octulosonic acid transferase [Hydrogenophilales bacterium 28-61-23]